MRSAVSKDGKRTASKGDKVECADIDKLLELVKTSDGVFNGDPVSCECKSPDVGRTWALFYLVDMAYIKSFLECDKAKVFADIAVNNTVWLELFQSAIGGFGGYLLYPFIIKLIKHKIKYIMLYPSATLAGNLAKRDALISLYEEKYGFRTFRHCLFAKPELKSLTREQARNYRVNPFDGTEDVENLYLVCTVENMYNALLSACNKKKGVAFSAASEASAASAALIKSTSGNIIEIECARCTFINTYINKYCEICGSLLPTLDEENNSLGSCMGINKTSTNNYVLSGGVIKYSHIKADYLSLFNY